MSRMEHLIASLRRHRLDPMADRLLIQECQRDRRPCVDRLLEAAQALDDARSARSLARRTREACLPVEGAGFDDLWTSVERNLLPGTLAPFKDGGWVRRKEHVVLVGKTGRGTTYLACVLAQAVLRSGMRVYYTEVPTLIEGWHAARDEGRSDEFMKSIERADLLVLDDWGNTDEQLGLDDLVALRRILRPMLAHRSVLIASKNPPEQLEEWLGGREIADELVDWLTHVPHHLELKGPSLRSRVQRPRDVRGSSRSSR